VCSEEIAGTSGEERSLLPTWVITSSFLFKIISLGDMRFTLHQSTYGEILETINRTLLGEELRESKRMFYK
jgi:hypothetical protein